MAWNIITVNPVDEVHASVAGEPASARICHAGREPQGDWHVQCREVLRVAPGCEWIDIRESRRGGKRRGHANGDGGRQAALPSEVGDEERQHEEAGISEVEQRVGVGLAEDMPAEQLRKLDGCGGRGSERKNEERFGAEGRPLRLAHVGAGDDELLPQPVGVFARELARQRVEAAHALDRDEKGFVASETSVRQRRHLIA
jgi:hypothetical protein